MNGTDMRKRLSDSVDELRRRRDELRLEIHLAHMEAKERWQSLEHVSRKAVDEISGKLRDFRTSLDELRRENRS